MGTCVTMTSRLGLKEKQLKGETVDIAEVHDREAREIITGLPRKGGARVWRNWWSVSGCLGTSVGSLH